MLITEQYIFFFSFSKDSFSAVAIQTLEPLLSVFKFESRGERSLKSASFLVEVCFYLPEVAIASATLLRPWRQITIL